MMIPYLEEDKKALKDLYAGLKVSSAVGTKIVHISPETAEAAIIALRYYIDEEESYRKAYPEKFVESDQKER